MGLTQITTGGVDDNISFDSNTLKIDGTNNRVGIGEGSPSATLHAKSGTTDVVADFESTDANAWIQIRDNSTTDTAVMVGAVGDDMRLRAGSNERVRIDSAGNVGIGTSSLNTNTVLSVHKGDSSESQMRFTNTTTGEAGNNGFLVGIDSSEGGRLFVQENNYLRFGTNNSERLRINSSGNVGIGTSSPSRPLSVSSSQIGARFTSTSADSQIEVVDTSGTVVFGSSSGSAIVQTGGSERARIDASGNLQVSSGQFTVGTTASTGLQFINDGTFGTINNADLIFRTNATERMRLDTSGNLVLKTTASAGDIIFKEGGSNAWSIETNGANGYLRFFDKHNNSERVRITNEGKVGIGTSSPQQMQHLHIGSTAACVTQYTNSVTGSGSGDGLLVGLDSTEDGLFWMKESQNLTFGTSNSERMRIDSSGRLLVGTSTSTFNIGNQSKLGVVITGDLSRGGIDVTGYTGGSSTGRSPEINFNRSIGTSDGSVTALSAAPWQLGKINFSGSNGSNFGLASQIYGVSAGTAFSGSNSGGEIRFATTNLSSTSPTEKWRINENGTFTNKTSNIGSVTGAGVTLESGGTAIFARSSANPVFINRISNDGNLIQFYGDNTLEGNIVINGTSVTLSGAHLSRWSQLPSGAARTEILRGSVLSNLDEMCEWGEEDNEQLNRMKVSDVEGDVNVSGVFMAWDDDDETYLNDFYCAMTGDFVIRIAQGTTVARGDLLMSAGDGTAKPQDDDIVRSKTIAKVTSTTVSTTYSDGSYCVPCVLMAC